MQEVLRINDVTISKGSGGSQYSERDICVVYCLLVLKRNAWANET